MDDIVLSKEYLADIKTFLNNINLAGKSSQIRVDILNQIEKDNIKTVQETRGIIANHIDIDDNGDFIHDDEGNVKIKDGEDPIDILKHIDSLPSELKLNLSNYSEQDLNSFADDILYSSITNRDNIAIGHDKLVKALGK